ncbi:PREDICTED: cell division cycle-associated protein 7-like [Brassica oleracea var. oleracea]|uniref:cell division cycle-associated protein 7-like n=1 Tax=Brassica oleracea var. oleracea TaxID=109376 RepID=UPI0006A6B1C3|nr:PREDICTED: cell division cycle-associated protein 7-like [Brassica oleracea var. oleracea]
MAMENMNGQIVNAATGEPMKMKNCHQCHKMRSDADGNCVTKKGATTCVLKYCPKCLLTRYGEIGEELAVNDNWVCPKCRKICNCSWCR